MTLDIRALSLSLSPSFAPRLTTVNEVSERGERSASLPRCVGYWLPALRRHLVLFVRLGFNLARTFYLSASQ